MPKLASSSTDYARLAPGAENPKGLQVCQDLAHEFVRAEDEGWISQACGKGDHDKCVMYAVCHCRVKRCYCSTKRENS